MTIKEIVQLVQDKEPQKGGPYKNNNKGLPDSNFLLNFILNK